MMGTTGGTDGAGVDPGSRAQRGGLLKSRIGAGKGFGVRQNIEFNK